MQRPRLRRARARLHAINRGIERTLARTPVRAALGVAAIQALLAYLYVRHPDHRAFYRVVRDVGVWSIFAAFVYKQLVLSIMVLTRPKTPLDRRWIWQTQAMAALMAYAFVLIMRPGVARDHPVAASWIWLNIWVQILWSAVEVLYFIWLERGRWAWGYLRLLVASWFGGPKLPRL